MHADQAASLATAFERFEIGSVSDAIDEHFRTHQFVNGRDLLAEIESRSRGNGDASNRFEAAILAADARRDARLSEVKRVAEDNACAAEIVGKLSASEQERLKVEVLAKLPFIAERLATVQVMKSPTLIGLIAKRLKAGAA